jgi:hypothetical protein
MMFEKDVYGATSEDLGGNCRLGIRCSHSGYVQMTIYGDHGWAEVFLRSKEEVDEVITALLKEAEKLR